MRMRIPDRSSSPGFAFFLKRSLAFACAHLIMAVLHEALRRANVPFATVWCRSNGSDALDGNDPPVPCYPVRRAGGRRCGGSGGMLR